MTGQILHDLTEKQLRAHLLGPISLGGHGYAEIRGDGEAQHNSSHALGDPATGTPKGWLTHTRDTHEAGHLP